MCARDLSYSSTAPLKSTLAPLVQIDIALPLARAAVLKPSDSPEVTVMRLIALTAEYADRLTSSTISPYRPVRRERFRSGLLQEFAVVVGRAHERGEPVDPAELSRYTRLVASAEAANYGVRGASRRIKQAFMAISRGLTKLKSLNQHYTPDKETDTLIDDMVSESLALVHPSLTPDTLKLALEWVAVLPAAHICPLHADTVTKTYFLRLMVADAAVRFAEVMSVAPNVTHQIIRDLVDRLLVRVEQVASDIERGTVQERGDLRASLIYRFSTSDLRLIAHQLGRDRPPKQILKIERVFDTIDTHQATLRIALRTLGARPVVGNEPHVNDSPFELR